MKTTDLVSLYTTVPDMETARTIAKHAVEARLAACANIVPGVQSIYHWQGEVVQDSEVILFLKTQGLHVEALMTLIAEHHPYTVPAMLVLPLEKVHGPYAQWLREETGAA